MTTTTRTFGIELEVVGKRGQQVGLWGRIVSALRAEGINFAEASYMGADYTRWQVKSDSSISCNGYSGAEVVSPVMPATEAGFAEVARVCRTIDAAGATANRTCGMHVHVDVRDLTVEQIKNVIKAYGHFQAEIDSVLPVSRRQSRWAAPLWNSYNRDAFLRRLNEAQTVSQIADRVVGTRYTVCNLMKYTRTGTLEFRQHSGTADAEKATTWARWCVAFVESFKNVDVTAARSATAGFTVMRAWAGRGEARAPRRGVTGRIVRALQNGPVSHNDLEVLTRETGFTPDAWVAVLARRYGVTVQAGRLSGHEAVHYCLPAADQSAMAAADTFAQCFACSGHLGYFGARRAALA